MKLGVNIDHVATIREARKTFEPDPVIAATQSEEAGCDGIVCHLRKDRRHINDRDLTRLRRSVTKELNLEMSIDPEIVDIACRIKPDQATIVPENRSEITTEGGLDVAANIPGIRDVVSRLSDNGIQVSLFIDPEIEQLEASKSAGVKMIEFHTGRYAELFNTGSDFDDEIKVLQRMTDLAKNEGMTACAGHGLNYNNVAIVAGIKGIYELNIGHSIISRAVFTGINEAVKKMKELIG